MNIEQQRRQTIVSIETLRYGKLFVLLSLLPLLLIYIIHRKKQIPSFCVLCVQFCVCAFVWVGGATSVRVRARV
jgi:hypothetical protein